MDLFKRKYLSPLSKAFLLSLVIFEAGAGLMLPVEDKYKMAVFILVLTTLSILASFNKKIRNILKTYDLGMYLILVFSMVVASKIDTEVLSCIDSNIFFYVLFVVVMTLLLHVLISSVFRIDIDTVIITSTALICSPSFVPVIAGSLHNREIILPGITVGIIGYAAGNYLGYLMFMLLIYFE